MKTLAELRTEVELGMRVYPATNHDVEVWREEANEFHELGIWRQSERPWYKLYRSQQTPLEVACTDEDKEMMGNCDVEHGYHSFDALLADWPSLASQPVWSTAKTPERIAYDEAMLQAYHARVTYDHPPSFAESIECDAETKFSRPRKLIDLEEVINTRTPVWDIKGSGDVRVKLDTDVNGQEWYVLSDDRSRDPLYGVVSCWAFPHFNGAHDQYCYEPVAFCFKTFAELLAAHPTERAMWAYYLEEYDRRRSPKQDWV